jgi:exodeoxyribonuclease V beta subunit
MRKAADKTFDLVKTPLQKGVTLLEASAGTGKTYSLAGLILRLVAEEFIPIREILAVTYTIAATAELKERVRERLHQAATQLRSGKFEDALVTASQRAKNRTKVYARSKSH